MYESLTAEYTVGALLKCILHCRTNHSTSYMYMYICTVPSITVPAAGYCASCSCTVPAAAVPATGTLPASTKHLPVHVHMYRYICTCSFDKAASTKAASTKLYQLLTSRCQLLSSGCQLVSSGCQLLSSECQLIFKIRQYQNISGICTS